MVKVRAEGKLIIFSFVCSLSVLGPVHTNEFSKDCFSRCHQKRVFQASGTRLLFGGTIGESENTWELCCVAQDTIKKVEIAS